MSQKNGNGEARVIVRSLIEKIMLTPAKGKKDLSLDLYGDLAGILAVATQEKNHEAQMETARKNCQ
ncbi:MAG: hypothetical protein ABW201_18435 [Candidatus Thiodiazotropha sp.]